MKFMKNVLAFSLGVASGILYDKYNKDICNLYNSVSKSINDKMVQK